MLFCQRRQEAEKLNSHFLLLPLKKIRQKGKGKFNKVVCTHYSIMAEIQGTPKGSLVYRFITSGKPGSCELCHSFVQKLEAHHVSYSPEMTIKLCHNCHHKCHFWPNRLTDFEKHKLLSLKYGEKISHEVLKNKNLSMQALAKLIAPSRSSFIHKAQLEEIKRVADEEQTNPKKSLKNYHSPKVKKFNKQVDLSHIKRIRRPTPKLKPHKTAR